MALRTRSRSRSRSRSGSYARAALILAALELCPSVSLAQGGDTATAEALFEQGKQLLRAGNAAAACPKLAESQRIDPSTGTLLALAMCHEADGKLASAWAEFTSVEARARNEGRSDREQAARTRAQALKPRLSTLEVRVSPQVAATSGLEIKRDGATFWRVYRDLDDGARYVERFIVDSWGDYLHQRARATLADQELEERVRSFLEAGETATMQHYIAER